MWPWWYWWRSWRRSFWHRRSLLSLSWSFFGTLRDSCFVSSIWATPFFWVWIRAKRMCNEYDVWGCILWSLTLTNWDDPPRTPNQSLWFGYNTSPFEPWCPLSLWVSKNLGEHMVLKSTGAEVSREKTVGGFFSSSQPWHWKTNLATQHHKTSIYFKRVLNRN